MIKSSYLPATRDSAPRNSFLCLNKSQLSPIGEIHTSFYYTEVAYLNLEWRYFEGETIRI